LDFCFDNKPSGNPAVSHCRPGGVAVAEEEDEGLSPRSGNSEGFTLIGGASLVAPGTGLRLFLFFIFLFVASTFRLSPLVIRGARSGQIWQPLFFFFGSALATISVAKWNKLFKKANQEPMLLFFKSGVFDSKQCQIMQKLKHNNALPGYADSGVVNFYCAGVVTQDRIIDPRVNQIRRS
jgi:hypothetical protein